MLRAPSAESDLDLVVAFWRLLTGWSGEKVDELSTRRVTLGMRERERSPLGEIVTQGQPEAGLRGGNKYS